MNTRTPEQGELPTALGGYRVLDLTDEKGLFCGQLLGMLGADVIKIERPEGDVARNIGPFFHGTPGPEKSLFWLATNTDKRGITLNIDAADGRDIFKKLVETADVLIESFRPGYLASIGLGYADLVRLNSKIIMTSITPFGQSGPYAEYQGPDLVCWAMSGLLFMTGDPQRPPVRISHIQSSFLLSSMDAAWATAMAIYRRGLSGKGQHVDVSIQESLVKTGVFLYENWQVTGMELERGSDFRVARSGVLRRAVWPTRDGYITVMLFTGQFGAPLTPRLVEWLDEEGMADDYLKGIDWSQLDWRNISREEGDRIHDYFGRFFLTKSSQELLDEALKRRIMLQPVSTPKDILNHPQLQARNYWQAVEHPELGVTLSYPGRFCSLSRTPCRVQRRAPLIGEHNDEIYGKQLGLTGQRIATLKQAGAI